MMFNDKSKNVSPIRYRLALTSCYSDSDGYLGIDEKVDCYFTVSAERNNVHKIDSFLLDRMVERLKSELNAKDQLYDGGEE